MEPRPDGGGRYAVIAGGRRLAAMQALAAEGALDEDHPVPRRMIGSIVAAEEVSLAENSVRKRFRPWCFDHRMNERILRQGKPWRGGCDELKPLVAIQRVRLPPGKGAARQPEASLTRRAPTPVVKRR